MVAVTSEQEVVMATLPPSLPSSLLSPTVTSLLSSAFPSTEALASTPSHSTTDRRELILDLSPLQAGVDAAVAGLEEEGVAWWRAASAALAPTLLAIHRRTGVLREVQWEEVEELVAWTSHPGLVRRGWETWREGGQAATLELLLLLAPVLERSLGDLLVTVTTLPRVPALIRDLLRREEVWEVLGQPTTTFLRLLLGSPHSLNLRNLAWHGFLAPGEAPPPLGPTLLLALTTIGATLAARGLVLDHRPLGSLARVARMLEVNPSLSTCLPATLPPSTCHLLPLAHLPLLHLALEHRAGGRHLASCLLLLPLLETCLRSLYVSVNRCPERLATAESTELYTTFTEMLGEVSEVQGELGVHLTSLLVDLFILPQGPRARDRLSHGEVAVEGEGEEVHLATLSSLLSTALGALLSPQPSLHLPPYHSTFHPAAQLASLLLRSIELLEEVAGEVVEARRRLQEVEQVQLEGGEVVVEVGALAALRPLLTPYRGGCLYRPRAEVEAVALGGRAAAQVAAAAGGMATNLREKAALWAARGLRSRARATYSAMLAAMPAVVAVLAATTRHLGSLLEGKDSIDDMAPKDLSDKMKKLKRVLKASENIATSVDVQKNRWDEALKHSAVLQSLTKS